MISLLREMLQWIRERRHRSEHLAAEIELELAQHMEQLTDDLMEAGYERPEAERIACQRFGDPLKHGAQCLRAKMEDPVMISKINTVLMVLVLAAVTTTLIQVRRGVSLVEPTVTVPAVVYLDGAIQRPGVYRLPESGSLSLRRLMAVAGAGELTDSILVEVRPSGQAERGRRIPGGDLNDPAFDVALNQGDLVLVIDE